MRFEHRTFLKGQPLGVVNAAMR